MRQKRVATLDIGTNSVLLLVGERQGSEILSVLEKATVTRLGQGVDQTHRLHPDACARTLACLRAYQSCLADLQVEEIHATATSAVRDASNSSSFLAKVEEILGSPPVVLSGEEEARLSFRGALQGLPLNGHVTMIDIGGGSTEIVQGHVSTTTLEVGRAVSKNVGCVRLTERHIRHDPPQPNELDGIRQDAQAAFRELILWPTNVPSSSVVAVAGTVTTLAAVVHQVAPYEPSKIHGLFLERNRVKQTLQHLISVPLSIRQTVVGMHPDRAEVLIAGCILLEEAMSALQIESVQVSTGGLRWGLLQETLWA